MLIPAESYLSPVVFVCVLLTCRSCLQEGKRQRLLEKALEACSASPYGQGVRHWVLAGTVAWLKSDED